MTTSAKIIFGLYDLTAKDDSSLTIEDKKSFSKIEELKNEENQETKYATLEKNYFNLNGEYKLLSDEITSGIGFCSNSMSDSSGNFTSPPTIEIVFNDYHSSNGITLGFSKENWSNDLDIYFYRDNELIENKKFTPNESTYFCSTIVESYNKIIIKFNSTHIPYRYIKLINIVYGQNKIFYPNEIMSANILEEIDLLSNEISINTLDFSIFSKDEAFNMLNPKGVYKLLQTMQKFRVIENTSSGSKDMGTFYLESWNNETDSISNMKAIDLIGILDKTKFNGGMYQNEKLINILTEIFNSANVPLSQLEISDNLKEYTLTGWIPICTHREAIQQTLFPIGAICDDSRSENIKIYKLDEVLNQTEINYSRKNQDTEKVELNDIVTGVQVTSHLYTQTSSEQQELYKGSLNDNSKIQFNEPVYNLSITGGEILEQNCNYCIVNNVTSDEVVIKGYKYVDNQQIFETKLDNLLKNDKENVLVVEKATMINPSIAKDISERILNYYQKTYKISFDFKLNNEEMATNSIIETLYNQKLKGNINKLDIDLTGGFIASTTVTGSLYEEATNEETNI